MVRRPAQVAGAGIGPQRLFPGVGLVRDLQKRNPQDLHLPHTRRGGEELVDEFPPALKFDAALPPPGQGRRQIHQGRGEAAIQRRIRRVVEVPHRHYSVQALRQEGIRQLPESFHRQFPFAGRGRPAVLGRMVVHQEGCRGSVRRFQDRQEDGPRGKDGGIGLENRAGLPTMQAEAGTAIEQRHIDPAGIRGVRVYHLIVQLPERRFLQ